MSALCTRCLQPGLWNVRVFSPDFPLVGKSDFAELSFSWFTYVNGYFCFLQGVSLFTLLQIPLRSSLQSRHLPLRHRSSATPWMTHCHFSAHYIVWLRVLLQTQRGKKQHTKITRLVQPPRWICSYCESHLNFTIKQPWNFCSKMLINLVFKSLNNTGQSETRKRKCSTEYLNGAKAALNKKWP